ncbi:ABC transporter substrate-binding protein [Alkalicoccus saliphilus]|jgi:multiple sugar transport system substrate-binding protein|uniref:ABC transporter substrate-binding protein n=1 Tax=Alkalicoccus saliphilus TaxID=200989 RepID=A0A2T4U3P3_9BACI|nr:ABC transporter substrate-binding protein [Alkalicoccus saliphilus]PTL38017.1 ABC transporter substrate-binding protein [Alkalicoccus saliphilus]
MKKTTLRKSMGITAFLLSGVVLTACGGNNGNSNGESTAESNNGSSGDQEEVTVRLTGWQSSPTEQRYFEETIDAFEEANPHINVEVDTIADQYMDVLRTRLIGGEAADVFFLDAFEAPGLIEAGVVEPLDDYVTDEFNIDDFEDPLIDAFRREDQLWGLPKDTSTLALFYNKEHFEEAGIESPPETWEEMEETAEELTTGDRYGFGIVTDLARLHFIAESQGGEVAVDNQANFTDPDVINALQPIIDMRNEKEIGASPADVGAEWGGDMFGTERASMIIEGNWMIEFMEDAFPEVDYGVVEIPKIEEERSTMAYTVSYSMNAASEKKEEAWQLIEFLTGEEGMETWTSSGLALPSRQSVAESLDYTDDEIYAPFMEGASYATVWADDTNLPIINSNFENQFSSAFLGDQSLEEAMEEAERTANNEIQD